MDTALVAAVATLAGIVLGSYLNRNTQARSWMREKRLGAYEAYLSACEDLLRDPLSPDKFAVWNEAHTRIRLLATYAQTQELNERRLFFENVHDGIYDQAYAMTMYDEHKSELLATTRHAIGAAVWPPFTEIRKAFISEMRAEFKKRPVATTVPFALLAMAAVASVAALR